MSTSQHDNPLGEGKNRCSAAFFTNNQALLEQVYLPEHIQCIREQCDLIPGTVGSHNFKDRMSELQSVDVVFSSWGMPDLSDEELQALPNVKAIFYAGGSVVAFAQPYLNRGVQIISAWQANAVPVAEFTLAQILLANKGYFQNIEAVRKNRKYAHALRGQGNYNVNISLLGAGAIGRKVIELLSPFAVNVQVFDPFLSPDQAASLGVRKVELEEAFATGSVVSNHLANVPETVGLLNRRLFQQLPENAVFINTGRGATVNEPDLIAVLHERPDLFALLDVTFPEPPAPDSDLYQLPNCRVSSHIAGSINREYARMADWILEEFSRWLDHKPLRYAVTAEMLKTMA